jgi:hypothetical protein
MTRTAIHRASRHENRWYPVVAFAIAISHFDRQTLPVAIATIQRNIPISDQQFSYLQTAFLLSYAALYIGGGRLLDVLGTRRGFMLIMLWWSIACALHGFARGFGLLLCARFLPGMGEGGGFPAAIRVVAEWISPTSFDRRWHHQCRDGSQVGTGTTIDRLCTAAQRMENGLLYRRRNRHGLGSVVGFVLPRQFHRRAQIGSPNTNWQAALHSHRSGAGLRQVYERFGMVLSTLRGALHTESPKNQGPRPRWANAA